MSQKIVAADLAVMSKVAPEIAKLGETDDEWWLGLFGLEKTDSYQGRASWTWPRWRDHMSNPVTATMRLRVESFQRHNGESAIGVVLVVPEDDTEQYVGWASQPRAEQITAWVDFLNGEIMKLRSLWNAAGRPTKNTPSPTAAKISSTTPAASTLRAASLSPTPTVLHATAATQSATSPATQYSIPRDDRVGRLLANGRFEVTKWIGTDYLMGAAVARDHDRGGFVRLTIAGDVAGAADDLRSTLAREIPGLAPVVYLGDTASDDDWAPNSMMMAEHLPDGAVELQLPSGVEHTRELAAIGARLAAHVIGVHRNGMVLGTLRPQSMFITPNGELHLLVRGERLWLMPRPNMTKPAMVPPWRPGYLAPELLSMFPLLRDPAPAADVFSLGVMLASALMGEFVYFLVSFSFTDLFVAQAAGKHLPLPRTPLGELLTRCLRPDPGARPSLEELEQELRREPD